jgi:hypothetical protein
MTHWQDSSLQDIFRFSFSSISLASRFRLSMNRNIQPSREGEGTGETDEKQSLQDCLIILVNEEYPYRPRSLFVRLQWHKNVY